MAMLNKQNVMRCIADHGPIHRSEIASIVGLSLPTVMDITDKLLEHGMIVAEKRRESGKGKRPEAFAWCAASSIASSAWTWAAPPSASYWSASIRRSSPR